VLVVARVQHRRAVVCADIVREGGVDCVASFSINKTGYSTLDQMQPVVIAQVLRQKLSQTKSRKLCESSAPEEWSCVQEQLSV
jgi:hypothetical protein